MIIRMVVDLPDPLGPRNPVTVPGFPSNVSPSTATVGPYRLVRPRTSIISNLPFPRADGGVRSTTLETGDLAQNMADPRLYPGVNPRPARPGLSRRRECARNASCCYQSAS